MKTIIQTIIIITGIIGITTAFNLKGTEAVLLGMLSLGGTVMTVLLIDLAYLKTDE